MRDREAPPLPMTSQLSPTDNCSEKHNKRIVNLAHRKDTMGREVVRPHTNEYGCALVGERALARKIVVSNEIWRRTTDDHIEIVRVDEFMRDLWAGKVIES